jgi:hypothetical protein
MPTVRAQGVAQEHPEGHSRGDRQTPWYTGKTRYTLTKLRRLLIDTQYSADPTTSPTPNKSRPSTWPGQIAHGWRQAAGH